MIHLRTWLIAATVLLIAACTAKLQQNSSNNKGDNTKKEALTAVSTKQLPIDSLIKRKEVDNGYTRYFFDTTKCSLFPDFTLKNIFTKPEYKALFGWTDDYVIESNPNIYAARLMYKNVPYTDSAFDCYVVNGCIVSAKALKFIPLNEPSEVRISLDEARKIVLQQEYPSRKAEMKKKFMDTLGYVPEKYREYLTESPTSNYAKGIYLPNAKFVWDKYVPTAADSIYYPKGELCYSYSGGVTAKLYYKFLVYSIKGCWYVNVNAITGEIYKSRVDPHVTCDPITATTQPTDYLWYYNNLNPMPSIDISTCSFGNCSQYRFANNTASSNINAFCQEGDFDHPLNNIHPHKSFIDWSNNNEHYSPTINVSATTLPSTINSTDGTATVTISAATGVPATTYTYLGTQIITTNGLISTPISTTASGSTATNLSAGIYELAITSSNACNYTEYIAIGYQTGFSVTATTTAADCYNNTGDIHLSVDNVGSFGGQAPQIIIKGAISTNVFAAVTDYTIEANKFEFNLAQFNVDDRPLPPGNYAILVRNPNNNKMTGVNVRLEYPACEVERKLLQTAYWAVERTHQLFRGNSTAINGGTNIDITLPTQVVMSPTTFNALPDNGYCQFSRSPNAIGIGIINDIANSALFVASSMSTTETLFKIAKGSNPNFPMVSLDILAHEYGHAINFAGMNVAQNGSSDISPEAEAINEGFSDIIGCIIEANNKSIEGCWGIGNDLPNSIFPTSRNIANPNSQSMPSIYNGTFWNPDFETEIVYGLQYIHSRVFSYWFYLLANGGSQTVNGITYTVPALGIEKAAKITLAAFVSKPYGLDETLNKNYSGLCVATSKAANALFGPDNTGVCSPEVQAVHVAWQAVGVNCWATIIPALCASCLPTDPDNNICDNHLPYLTQVTLKNADETTFYSQSWTQNPEDITLTCLNGQETQATDFAIGIFVETTSSETLSNLNLIGLEDNNGTL